MVGSRVRGRRARLLAKTCWTFAVAYAAWLATRGLGTGFLELDPAEILRSDRHAQALLSSAGFLFLVLATVAWIAFRGPVWSVLLLGGVAVACFVMTTTDARFVAVPLLWPTVAAAATGVLTRPPAVAGRPGEDAPISRG